MMSFPYRDVAFAGGKASVVSKSIEINPEFTQVRGTDISIDIIYGNAKIE